MLLTPLTGRMKCGDHTWLGESKSKLIWQIWTKLDFSLSTTCVDEGVGKQNTQPTLCKRSSHTDQEFVYTSVCDELRYTVCTVYMCVCIEKNNFLVMQLCIAVTHRYSHNNHTEVQRSRRPRSHKLDWHTRPWTQSNDCLLWWWPQLWNALCILQRLSSKSALHYTFERLELRFIHGWNGKRRFDRICGVKVIKFHTSGWPSERHHL